MQEFILYHIDITNTFELGKNINVEELTLVPVTTQSIYNVCEQLTDHLIDDTPQDIEHRLGVNIVDLVDNKRLVTCGGCAIIMNPFRKEKRY